MSVRVPISADASSAVNAVDRLSQALRKAGMDAKQLSKIDLGNMGQKKLSQQIGIIDQNFSDIKQHARGETGSALRKGGYSSFWDWDKNHTRQYPNPREAAAHYRIVSRAAMRGTAFEAPLNESGGGGGGGEVGAGAHIRRGGASLLSAGSGFLKKALGLAGLGGVAVLATKSIRMAQTEAETLDPLQRALGTTTDSFLRFRANLEHATRGLAVNSIEMVKFTSSYARLSAAQSQSAAISGARTAIGFGRSFGLAPEESGSLFGRARFMAGPHGPDARRLALIFAETISSSHMFSQSSQVMSSMLGYIQSSERTNPDFPNIVGFGKLFSAMNRSDHPGLRGEMGAALIGRMNQSVIQGGGAGPAGQNFLYQALNQHGRTLGPFQTRMLEEGGLFATRKQIFGMTGPGSKETNFENIKHFFKRMFPGAPSAQEYDAVGRLFGISALSAKDLLGLKSTHFSALGDMLKKYKINLKNVNPTGIEELSKIATDSPKQLEAMKSKYLKAGDLSSTDRNSLKHALTPDNMRKALAGVASHSGRTNTVGYQTLQSIANLDTTLTKVGHQLVKPMNKIRDSAAGILKYLVPNTAAQKTVYKMTHDPIGAIKEAAVTDWGYGSALGAEINHSVVDLLHYVWTHGPNGSALHAFENHGLIPDAGKRLEEELHKKEITLYTYVSLLPGWKVTTKALRGHVPMPNNVQTSHAGG